MPRNVSSRARRHAAQRPGSNCRACGAPACLIGGNAPCNCADSAKGDAHISACAPCCHGNCGYGCANASRSSETPGA